MRYNANEVQWETVAVLGKIMLFSDCRVDRKTVPDGMYMYEVRHADDDWGDPCEIAEGVLVNFFGTLLSREKLPLKEHIKGSKPYISLDSYEDWAGKGSNALLANLRQDVGS